MAQGRPLYRKLALAALANSKELLRDANRLARAGSRGHASALAILSIEESAKGLVYNLAAQVILRVVKRNPNGITTFREADMLDHRVKHAFVSGLLADALFYGPFYEAASRLKKLTFSREEVRSLIEGALIRHRRLRFEIQRGARTSRDLGKLFNLLEGLNVRKNRGLYVDHRRELVLIPDDIPRKDLVEILELSTAICEIVAKALEETIPPHRRAVLLEENRKFAEDLLRARTQARRQGPGGDIQPRPPGSKSK